MKPSAQDELYDVKPGTASWAKSANCGRAENADDDHRPLARDTQPTTRTERRRASPVSLERMVELNFIAGAHASGFALSLSYRMASYFDSVSCRN